MKTVKVVITLFFLLISYWVTYLIFGRNFSHAGISFAVDNWTENTFMILLISTGLSIVGVFFTGILSMFTHFIFIRLIYADEIKQAAYFYVKNRNKKEPKELQEYKASVAKLDQIKKSTVFTRIRELYLRYVDTEL